jgi:hypothetical protein
MDILVGNAEDADTQGTGWFIGFSPWASRPDSDLLFVPKDQALSGLCVKWFRHETGHQCGSTKPVSEGRTVSILIGNEGQFKLEFSPHSSFDGPGLKTVLLAKPGDFAAWGAGVFHRWECVQSSTVLTIRWTP